MQMQTLQPKPLVDTANRNTKNKTFDDVDILQFLENSLAAEETQPKAESDNDASETKESITPNTESEPLADDDDSNETTAPSTAELDNALGLTDEGIFEEYTKHYICLTIWCPTDKLNDAELNRLIKETMEMRKNNKSPNALSEEAKKRQEYDDTEDNVNFVNYHLSLFTFLVVLTLLNAPSVIAWFKNFA